MDLESAFQRHLVYKCNHFNKWGQSPQIMSILRLCCFSFTPCPLTAGFISEQILLSHYLLSFLKGFFFLFIYVIHVLVKLLENAKVFSKSSVTLTSLEVTKVNILKYFLPNSLLKPKLHVAVSFCTVDKVNVLYCCMIMALLSQLRPCWTGYRQH